MALGSGPKNAGKKPSRRKRTNKEKPEVTKVVDLLQQRTFSEQVPVPSFPPSAIPVPPATGENVPSAVPIAFPPVSAPTTINFPPNVLPSRQIHQPTQQNFAHYIPEMVQHQGFNRLSTATATVDQMNSFWLKWLPGTRVTRCYGCNGEIRNPPVSVPDDLIVAYRDVRQYRQKNTGQILYSNGPQNVHFHLRAACIRARYPSFPGASALVVTSDVRARFRLEHIQRLYTEFGWSP